MNEHIANAVLMVRPQHFGFNEETAQDNAFQQKEGTLSSFEIKEAAKKEFDALVKVLRAVGIYVVVIQDTDLPHKPDAVFPNNWFTTHKDGTIVTYPMFSTIRRQERREEVFEELGRAFSIENRVTLQEYEQHGKFLESTGSMVLDRGNKMAYACRSERMNEEVLDDFCTRMGYQKIVFDAVDKEGKAVYHTNVVMAMGLDFVIICMESIPKEEDRLALEERFNQTGKTIISIGLEQMHAFAGNMLQIKTKYDQRILVMSEQAYQSLTDIQVRTIAQYTDMLYAPLATIEKYGGGSARCMIAEVFLPRK